MRNNVLVKLKPDYRNILERELNKNVRGEVASEWGSDYYYNFLSNDVFVFLGEIANMPGHGIFVGRDGKMYWGFHPDDFYELEDDEV